MNSNTNQNFIATAFISTSLHEEDRPAVDFIMRILSAHKIKSIGTVGLLDASAENPTALMKKNIPNADFIVVIATPRYVQTDIRTGKRTLAIGEMLQVESGMAFACDKPVLVFAMDGAQLGPFLPYVTQYITLTGREDDLQQKLPLIKRLLTNTLIKVQEIIQNRSLQQFGNFIKTGLAVYGAYKLFESLTDTDQRITTRKRPVKRRRSYLRPKSNTSARF